MKFALKQKRSSHFQIPVSIVFVVLIGIFSSGTASDADLDEILKDVDEVGCEKCSPGVMAVFGSNAFPIVASESWGLYYPTAAASRYGDGRIVAFSHDNFLYPRPTLVDSDRFLLNVMNWASFNKQNNSKIPTIAIFEKFGGAGQLADFLNQNGYQAQLITYDVLLDPSLLTFDVIVVQNMFAIEFDAVDNFQEYVKNGGSIVLGCTSWNGGDLDISVFPGNKIITDAGMTWIRRGSSPTSSNGHFNVSKVLLNDLHSMEVAYDVSNSVMQGVKIPEGRANQMLEILRLNLDNVPKNYLTWTEWIKSAVQSMTPFIPNTENPVVSTPENRFQYELENIDNFKILDPQEVVEHPSAKYFPGAVSSALKSNSEPVTIQINYAKRATDIRYQEAMLREMKKHNQIGVQEVSFTKWFGTGLYAPPGSVVNLNIENPTVSKFAVLIGCHTDDISGKTEWVRYPKITEKISVRGSNITIASPFGGLIYVSDIESENVLPVVSLTVTGAIPTPSFFLGETSLTKWRNEIRNIKSPWAEFTSKKFSMCIQGDVATTVDDPEELMSFWDKVIDANSDLAVIPREANFQRIAFDVDIRSGWMHSGMPIMAYLTTAYDAVNVSQIRRPDGHTWGYYHEIGHNMQSINRDWTLEGGGEVTCNIFAWYVLNTVAGVPIVETREFLLPENLKPMVQKYINDGTRFEDLVSDYNIYLVYYYQLQSIYGWEVFKSVFKAYSELPSDERPVNDAQKRDVWVVIFSQTVRENLIPFFESWGFPSFSDDVRQLVSGFQEPGHRISSLLE